MKGSTPMAYGVPIRPAARLRRRVVLAAAALPLAACAPLTRKPAPSGRIYIGRLMLSVRSEPPQNLSAGFELRGLAHDGELLLTTPLGTTLALARWAPGEAQLITGGRVQTFASMEDLLMQITGAALPLPALFDWLAGRATAAPGWNADLSQREQGRLSARRSQPQPTVELRLLLDDSR